MRMRFRRFLMKIICTVLGLVLAFVGNWLSHRIPDRYLLLNK